MGTLADFYAQAVAKTGDDRRFALGAAYRLNEYVQWGYSTAAARALVLAAPKYSNALTNAALTAAYNAITISSGASYSSVVLADSPSFYYKLEETSGTSAAEQVAANAGTYVNAPTLAVAGIDGNAVQFTAASSQEMTIPGAGVSTNCAIELWFKWTAGATLMRDNTTTNGWIIGFDNAATFTVRIGATTTLATSKTTAQVQDGNWHHLVVAKTGAQCDVYLDNASIATTAAATSTGSVGVWHIARNGASVGVYTDMTADEIAIYPAALSAARVAAHFAARPA